MVIGQVLQRQEAASVPDIKAHRHTEEEQNTEGVQTKISHSQSLDRVNVETAQALMITNK